MRYYALYENNKLIAIGTGFGGVEISKEEYIKLMTVIREKIKLANQINDGAITSEDVPEEWREDVINLLKEIKTQYHDKSPLV